MTRLEFVFNQTNTNTQIQSETNTKNTTFTWTKTRPTWFVFSVCICVHWLNSFPRPCVQLALCSPVWKHVFAHRLSICRRLVIQTFIGKFRFLFWQIAKLRQFLQMDGGQPTTHTLRMENSDDDKCLVFFAFCTFYKHTVFLWNCHQFAHFEHLQLQTLPVDV